MAVVVTIVVAAAVAFGVWFGLSDRPPVTPSGEEYPVKGVDISAHNGTVDFDKVRADGFEFVILKATEGTDFKDRSFVDNYRRAAAAGLKVGAYHFFRFDVDGYMQGLNLLHSIRGRELHLPVAIDVEDWSNPAGIDATTIVYRLRKLVGHLEEHGHSVMFYTNKKGYQRYIRGNFDNYPLWLASFTRIDEDVPWSVWQYTHHASVDGVPTDTDASVFAGNTADWATWLENPAAVHNKPIGQNVK